MLLGPLALETFTFGANVPWNPLSQKLMRGYATAGNVQRSMRKIALPSFHVIVSGRRRHPECHSCESTRHLHVMDFADAIRFRVVIDNSLNEFLDFRIHSGSSGFGRP